MDEIIDISLESLKNSTDLYEFAKELNTSFTYQDKVDFICFTFEVAFADGTLHYLEEFFIKKQLQVRYCSSDLTFYCPKNIF